MAQDVERLEEPLHHVPLSSQQPDEMKFIELEFTSITEYGWEDTSDTTAKIYLLKNLDGIKLHD